MIAWLVKKRKITLLFFAMMVIYGFITVVTMVRQEMPDIVVDQAIVSTVYPGATPERVEQAVTKILEQKISEIQGLDNIQSTSNFQSSVIIIQTKKGVVPKEKWDELRKKVTDAQKDLPKDCKQSVVKDDLNRTFITAFCITASTPQQLDAMRDTLKMWKDQIRTIPHVAGVEISGLPNQEVRVELDTQRLNQYGIPWGQVLGSVRKENEKTPLGDYNIKDRNYKLKVSENYDADQLNRVIVAMSKEGFPIYMADVGHAALVNQEAQSYVYFNGKPSVTISVVSETGSDVPSLQKAVDGKVETLKKTLPAYATLNHVYSQTERINDLFGDLSREISISILAVLFVCALGLNGITATVIAMAIPISLAIGLMFTPNMGISMNMISVVALIIVLGILVDDAVVVNDNIERRLSEEGDDPFNAAVKGSNEVFGSILTSTLATICAFGPLMFLTGNVGQFIKPIPIIISMAMLASMAMSFTIVPIFRHWHEERNFGHANDHRKAPGLLGKQLQTLAQWYARELMPKILKKPLKTGLVAVLISTLAYGLFPFIPVELFPNSVRGEMLIDVESTYGTSIEGTDKIVRGVADWVGQQPGVKLVNAYSGMSAPNMFRGDMGNGSGPTVGQVVVLIDKKKVTTAELEPVWKKELSKRFPGATVIPKELKSGPPVGSPVSIRLYGENLDTLRSLTQRIKDEMAAMDGLENITDSIGGDSYTLNFEVNKAMMDRKMVNYADLTSTIRLASEGLEAGQFDNGKDMVDIKVYSRKDVKDPIKVFQKLSVTNAVGQQVPVSALVTFKPGFSIKVIPHRDLARYVEINADTKGLTATEAMSRIQKKISKMEIPPDFRVVYGGETSEQNSIFVDMGKLMFVAVFMILLLIALQFYSLSLPFLVLSTVYLAFAGSLVGMFLTRTPLGFMSVMGLICLVGIVVRNGIVLIEFIEEQRKHGVELKEAVIEAGRIRLRPVLLTAATAIAGLMSLATSNELMFRALAITIIFGLFFSTAMTLVVVPAFYTALAERHLKVEKKRAEQKELRRAKMQSR